MASIPGARAGTARTPTSRAGATRSRAYGPGGERGAVLVESAFLMPFVLLLVFGIIEFSFAFQADAVLNDAARSAGRAGASLAGDPGFGEGVASVASDEARKLPGTATPAVLLIYEANAKGYPCGTGAVCDENASSFSYYSMWTCWLFPNSTCVAGIWDPATERFQAPAGGWQAADQDACAGTGETYADYDRIGVAIFARYEPLTSMFDPVLQHDADLLGGVDSWDPVGEHAAFVFEPEPLGAC